MVKIEKLSQEVHRLFLEFHEPAHDVKHALRVSGLAKKIAAGENYDVTIAGITGLLHDMGRTIKNRAVPHSEAGIPIAKELLGKYTEFSEETKAEILSSIEHHSDLKTEGVLSNILQDADKIDGMGAIGISRAYLSWSPDYNPENIVPPPGKYGAFNNAHELISLEIEWYNQLYTKTAKDIARPRHEFAKRFMEEIKREIEESS